MIVSPPLIPFLAPLRGTIRVQRWENTVKAGESPFADCGNYRRIAMMKILG
jgi:hypothetical protein